jgi:nicotinamide riboside transporter PnuC
VVVINQAIANTAVRRFGKRNAILGIVVNITSTNSVVERRVNIDAILIVINMASTNSVVRRIVEFDAIVIIVNMV